MVIYEILKDGDVIGEYRPKPGHEERGRDLLASLSARQERVEIREQKPDPTPVTREQLRHGSTVRDVWWSVEEATSVAYWSELEGVSTTTRIFDADGTVAYSRGEDGSIVDFRATKCGEWGHQWTTNPAATSEEDALSCRFCDALRPAEQWDDRSE